LIKEVETGCVLGTLDKDQEVIVIARGGKGGLGNRHRRDATPGEEPQEKKLVIDLKLIADVGIVGFPNAGKSTLISSISNARPAIGAYPFTTQYPVLGVVQDDESSFVIADIPGLIENSSKGRGLGDRFLRHVERTRVLLHMIDMAGTEGRDPVEDYRIIIKELKSYSKEISKKPQILVANKMDLAQAEANLARFRKTVKKKIYPVSALEKQGLEDLVGAIRKKL
jgi:GTP-binding protein